MTPIQEALAGMASEVAVEWGRNIRQRRVTEMSVQRFEGGFNIPRDRTRWALAHSLDIDVDELFPSPPLERIGLFMAAADEGAGGPDIKSAVIHLARQLGITADDIEAAP